MSVQERTYIMVKVSTLIVCARRRPLIRFSFQPDGVQRGLVGNIISRFEQRGFKLIALKLVHATPEHLEKREYPFFFSYKLDLDSISTF